MAKKDAPQPNASPAPAIAPAAAPPLNRVALTLSVAAYLLWLLFLLAVATGLIR